MNRKVFCAMIAGCILGVSQMPLEAAQQLSPKERLGKLMYEDVNFSFNQSQSCQTCHHPDAGFADPVNVNDPYNNFVSKGADGSSLGGRNAPTSAYTGFSPTLHYNAAKNEYVGGMFWDGRATGETLGDPLAEQAQGPPLNPVEMNMPNIVAVVEEIRNASYADLFEKVYGKDSLVDDPLSQLDEATVFNQFGDAIAAYERSAEVQKFSSKYDTATLSVKERRGFSLYKEHCSVCHTKQHKISGTNATVDTFTSYRYANIGTPVNPHVPLDEPDLGLGYTIDDPAQDGKFKIPTLRNVAITAPYSHNGYFPTLQSIVEFKNSGLDGVVPEVADNISPLIGNMGMTADEMDDLIAFLMALTDQ
ncbi:cytochrome-c peroxidase [Desulfopila aestuarii]|uniref:Cytochrome c peroxidase n=1 Tax=Desulfopila aestuarii DSM 18488 TaxID=1121416 RepID=A0A1M7YMY4_9BACT|nr:cytochrome c peroxidase [Desulfopila aestuarii]SHO53908.1 Cytochrome c peroxidase [Desulfopila aestuarii DSM 18488]